MKREGGMLRPGTSLHVDLPDSECTIRPYRAGDAPALQQAADDIMVTRYMFAGFPYPYSIEDAEWWVEYAQSHDPMHHLVIEVDGAFAGSISVVPQGVSYAAAGIIGFWLAPVYWNRGIATAAIHDICELAFASGYERLEANVYEPNIGSARALEKNDFVLEGRLRKSRLGRDGAVMDELIFGKLKSVGATASAIGSTAP